MTGRPPDAPRMNWLMRASLGAFIVSILFAAGWTIMLIIIQTEDVRYEMPVLAPLILGSASSITLMCGWFLSRGRFPRLMYASALAIAVCAVILIARIWIDVPQWTDDVLAQSIGTVVLIVMILMIHAGYGTVPLTDEPFADDPSVQRFRIGARWLITSGCALSLAMIWIGPLVFDPYRNDSAGFIYLAVTLMFAAGLICAGLVPLRMRGLRHRHMTQRETLPRDVMIEMTCPHCGSLQQFKQGSVRCDTCRAEMFIELEEPRCACGYVLYRLSADFCPECGRDVSALMHRVRPDFEKHAGEPESA